MKNLILNSFLLFILIIYPLLPSYLHMYNQISNPKIKLCVKNGNYESMNILKGDLADLEAFFTIDIENESDNNGMPIEQELINRLNLFVNTSSSKLDVKAPIIIIDKLFYSENNDLAAIYLKIPSPPPKYTS